MRKFLKFAFVAACTAIFLIGVVTFFAFGRGEMSKDCYIQQVSTVDAGVAATTDITSDEVDMQGCEGVIFVIPFGTITGSAVTSIYAQQDTVTGMGTAADLEGTSQTVADTDDNTTFYIDIVKPRERFVHVIVDRGTQNAVVGSITAIKYGVRKVPVTQPTGTSGETHVSPAEGTK